MEKFDICGVKISAINLRVACDIISGWIERRSKAYVCVIPVSTIVECQENKEYREIVNAAQMATPDGMPLVWMGRLKGYRQVQRTYGPDLMVALCAISQEKGYRHYFYGGTQEACDRLELVLKKKFPKLNIIGKYAPPFRELSETEDKKITDDINRDNPDVLWVGLGSPKQDFWLKSHRALLNAPVILGVGAAFDFISGVKRQAPRWMQKVGLEWLFRLGCEPKRLWRRYLIGNSKFIFYLLKDLITRKMG